MGKILGSAVIRANSKQLKTKPGSQLNPGGFTTTDHPGPGKSWGKSRTFVPPSLQVTIAADEDVDVIEINALENVTITWEGDNNVDYMMTGSSPKDPFSLSDSGDISGTFEGVKVEKV